MFNYSVNELSTYRWSFEDDVAFCSSNRIAGLGVLRCKLEEFGVEKGAQLLRDSGVKASSLSWAGGFTGSDGRGFRDAIHDALDAIEIASEIDAGCLIVVAGDRNGHTNRHANRLFTQALTELSEAAAAMHVELAVEPMHAGCGSEACFLNNLHKTIDAIGDVSWPGVGVVLDTYHVGHDEQLPQRLPAWKDMIKLVQLGDRTNSPLGEQDRCIPGQGKLPITTVLETLEDIGYEGFVEVEVYGESVEDTAYQQIFSETKSYLDKYSRVAQVR